MDIKTLESFRLADAISFHDNLNPKLWDDMKLRPEVKKQLKLIAEDFIDELGINGLDIVDVTVSGSNAAYSYTPHSDLDLHILVDMKDMPDDEVYKELFNAKKNIYNDSHDISIYNIPVELYIQDANEPVKSLGEYSIKNDKWLKLPTKRRANLDQTATKQKYDKLLDVIKSVMKSKDLNKIDKILKKIKQYRQAGLDKGGEFGPENLAYKVLRSQGYINKLYQLRSKLHSEKLTIENTGIKETVQYKEIEFVCVNPKFPDATDKKLQEKMFVELKKIPGVIPLLQDHGEGQKSLTAIYKDKVVKQFVTKLAKDLGIKIDLIKPVSEKYVDRAIRGEHEGQIADEDYDPNGPPPGPEFKPTMPRGTVRVDVSDVYDWYKLGQHISNMKGLGKHDFGRGPPSTILAFGDEDTEHKYIQDLLKTGLTTTDIDPKAHDKKKNQKVDPTYNVNEETEHYNGIDISLVIEKDDDYVDDDDSDNQIIIVKAFSNGKELGNVLFTIDYDSQGMILKPQDLEVEERFRGQGIAKTMYDYVKSKGYRIRRSGQQTDAGSAFWNKHRPEENVWEDDTLQYASEKTPVISPYAGVKDRQYRSGISETSTSKLSYQGNCTENDVIEYIFGDVNNFARMVEEYGDEFAVDDLVVKYDPIKDIHYFYYKKTLEEASGYIPSEKEKNDPRFKTALTVDINPYSIKNNAKRLGSKISRAGIPPTLSPSGKY